ncbi:MAG: hypothetical protein J3Q66DRAFT_423658 [Benniella sp.]|nr:MAG: hypothetical protein J3Q66DRAFT_423658 [Benniella sp.]
MEQTIANVKAMETKVKPVRKEVSIYQNRQTMVSHELHLKEKSNQQTTSSTVTYGDLYQARQDLPAKSPRKKSTSGTRPADMTTADYSVEDATEHLDISALLEEHGKVIELKGGGSKKWRITFAGTDYGVCKMSETVPQTLDQTQSHLNRYQVLAGLQDTFDSNEDGKEVETSSSPTPALPVPTSGPSKQQRAETLAAIKLPDAITITAPQISEASSTRRIERRRQRRLQ